jgi:hypothetical protein
LLGYDSNSHAYHVFNKDFGCVETTCDMMFDETNDSQMEKLDIVDDEKAPCDILQRMIIGDVRLQDPSEQLEELSPNDTTPPTQELDQDQEMDQAEHEDKDEHNDQVQEESNDQGEDEDDRDKDGSISRLTPPHPRVHHIIQRDHLVDYILDDTKKGVTTRSRIANFCEYYPFVSSFEPFKIEDALRDLDWVVTMHEELNNFKQNKARYLVERPKKNVVRTKWVFLDKQDEHRVMTRNKALLVAKGYSQVKVLDFHETFAPETRLESIYILLAYATHHDFTLYQMDVKSTFLNGLIKKSVCGATTWL